MTTTARTPSRRRRRRSCLGILAATFAMLGGLLTAGQAQAAADWVKGPVRADTVLDCPAYTQGITRYGDGVSMQLSYLDDPNDILKVGETFYARLQMRLITLPCVRAGVVPEFILPAGLTWADDAQHPVRWSVSTGSGAITSGTDKELVIERGVNGGIVFGTKLAEYQYNDAGVWELTRPHGVYEIQVPLRATRPMKGDATPVPDCYTSLPARAVDKLYHPCPVDQAGDHLQVGLAIDDGGDRNINSTYVGVFAEANGSAKPPVPSPGPKASSTTVSLSKSTIKAGRRAKVTVKIASAGTRTGRVHVYDGSRRIASATLKPAHRGRVTVTLPRLRKGKHKLSVRYAGDGQTQASRSRIKTLTVKR